MHKGKMLEVYNIMRRGYHKEYASWNEERNGDSGARNEVR